MNAATANPEPLPDVFAVLAAMAARAGRGERSPLTDEDEEAVSVIAPLCLAPVIGDLREQLIAAYGGSRPGKSVGPDPDALAETSSTAASRYLAGQSGQPAGVSEGMSMLWHWFLDDTEREPPWRAVLAAIGHEEPAVRGQKARLYLIRAGRHWLQGQLSKGNSNALLNARLKEALRDGRFAAVGGTPAHPDGYTLKAANCPLASEAEFEGLMRAMPRRQFELREEKEPQFAAAASPGSLVRQRIPYASDLRDALADAMRRAQCGFTMAQARAVVRWVFSIPVEVSDAPLPEDEPEEDPRQLAWERAAVARAREEPGFAAEAEAEAGAGAEPLIEAAVEAVVRQIEREDGVPAAERPEDAARGRVARYFLDFVIWEGAPLAPGPALDGLLARLPLKRPPAPGRGWRYDLTLFCAWSGLPDASVSGWRKRGLNELLALALRHGLGWELPRARTFLDSERPPESRRRRTDAFNCLRAVVRGLRVRFLRRKPEFVVFELLET
jgi:hypothetical protein